MKKNSEKTPLSPEKQNKPSALGDFFGKINFKVHSIIATHKARKDTKGTVSEVSTSRPRKKFSELSVVIDTKAFYNKWKYPVVILSLVSGTSFSVGNLIGKRTSDKTKQLELAETKEQKKIIEAKLDEAKKEAEEGKFNTSQRAGTVIFSDSLVASTYSFFPDQINIISPTDENNITLVFWPQTEQKYKLTHKKIPSPEEHLRLAFEAFIENKGEKITPKNYNKKLESYFCNTFQYLYEDDLENQIRELQKKSKDYDDLIEKTINSIHLMSKIRQEYRNFIQEKIIQEFNIKYPVYEQLNKEAETHDLGNRALAEQKELQELYIDTCVNHTALIQSDILKKIDREANRRIRLLIFFRDLLLSPERTRLSHNDLTKIIFINLPEKKDDIK